MSSSTVESVGAQPVLTTDPQHTCTQAAHYVDSRKGPGISFTTTEAKEGSFSWGSGDQEGRTSIVPAPWQQRWLRLGPLSGIVCICLAACSMLASLAILVASDHSPTSSWRYQPSTYLAICTALANQSMRYAAVQGIIIAWWTEACRGSTLEQLHRSWHAGFTVRGALAAGRAMGLLGLATIFSTIVVFDGPLLQRASSVESASMLGVEKTLNVTIAPQIPTNWTGGWGIVQPPVVAVFNETQPSSSGSVSNAIQPSMDEGPFTNTVNDWMEQRPMSGFIKGCPGQCRATVTAPALSVESCTTRSEALTYKGPWIPSRGTGVIYGAPFSQTGLLISGGILLGDYEKINLVTGYSAVSDCEGNFTYTACTLVSAIGEYDVILDNEEYVHISGPPKIRQISNNTAITDRSPTGFHYSTLGGIVLAMYEKWYTSCYLYDVIDGGVDMQDSGVACQEYTAPVHKGVCPSYLDPHKDVLNDLNELMFRTGVNAGMNPGATHYNLAVETLLEPGLTINSTIIGQVQGQRNVFHTDFSYFIGAALLELVCIAFVLPTYWGFWRLGRAVSLSPLEIAKAFEAPLLQECHSNSTGNEIVRTVGATKVLYGTTGIVANADSARKLALTQASIARSPTQGTNFDA